MSMKQARKMHRQAGGGHSFREWARNNLKGTNTYSKKLRSILQGA